MMGGLMWEICELEEWGQSSARLCGEQRRPNGGHNAGRAALSLSFFLRNLLCPHHPLWTSNRMAGIQLDVWYLSMPPITRAFMTACVATTVLEYLGIVSIMDLYLNFSLITERSEVRLYLFYSFTSYNRLLGPL